MINAVAAEALYSATYVDNYIESVDNVPDDLQRLISRIREIDVQYRNLLRDVDHYYDLCHAQQSMENSESRRQRVVMRMHACLVRAQELGDEKMHLVNNMQELIDQKTRQMDTDKENLEIREDLEQLRLSQAPQEECPPLAKHARTQSPVRLDMGGSGSCSSANAASIERILSKDAVGSTFSGYSVVGAIGERATPNIDENVLNIEAARGNNKRSRRRNDTANNHSMEFGNESNSTNEGGSNGSERPATSRTNSVSSQKKGAGQHQTGLGNSSGACSTGVPGSVAGTSGSSGGVGGSNSAGKKKKRKARSIQTTVQTQSQTNARDETPPAETIDPDEPTYCICNQISFGEMILCDNDLCPIEWFHFSCVSLVLKPKGKWYCPNCRGDRPNIMKPKAQFLKELERYNKEKEEKT